jgi:hypothetical protein
MKNPALSFLCALCLTLAGSAGGLAQTEDIVGIVRSGICPKDLSPYETVKYSVHCAGMDERSCDINDKACFEDAKQCWDQVNLLNKQIFSYNNFVRKCAPAQPPADAAPKPRKKANH